MILPATLTTRYFIVTCELSQKKYPTVFCDTACLSHYNTFGLHWVIDYASRQGYQVSVVMAPYEREGVRRPCLQEATRERYHLRAATPITAADPSRNGA